MEALDQNATILDPEVPQKRDAYRRIWLGKLVLEASDNLKQVYEGLRRRGFWHILKGSQ